MPERKILVPLNQSKQSLEIIPCVEKLFPPGENELLLFYVTNPPGNVGFGEPDLGAGYVPMPGDKSVKPTLHPIYATQQEDNIRAHVKAELAPLLKRLREDRLRGVDQGWLRQGSGCRDITPHTQGRCRSRRYVLARPGWRYALLFSQHRRHPCPGGKGSRVANSSGHQE